MSQTLEQTDFTDRCGGDTIVLLLQSDFLQGDRLTGLQIAALIHDTVSSLTKLLLTLIAIQL